MKMTARADMVVEMKMLRLYCHCIAEEKAEMRT
jgi:hypothetical protein